MPLLLSQTVFMVSGTIISNPKLLSDCSSYFYIVPKFEQQLWQAADKLRGHMDAGEYKHVVLGLIFLK